MWHFSWVCICVCVCVFASVPPLLAINKTTTLLLLHTAAAASLLHLHFDFLALSLQFRNSFCCRLRAHILTLLSEHDSLMRARSLPKSCLQAASMSSKLLAARYSLPCLSSCLAWCCSQAQRQMKSQQQCRDKDLAASGSSDTHTYNRVVPAPVQQQQVISTDNGPRPLPQWQLRPAPIALRAAQRCVNELKLQVDALHSVVRRRGRDGGSGECGQGGSVSWKTRS